MGKSKLEAFRGFNVNPRAFTSRDRAVLDVLCDVPLPVTAVQMKYERRTGRVLSLAAARDACERLRVAGLAKRRKRGRGARGYILYRKAEASLS